MTATRKSDPVHRYDQRWAAVVITLSAVAVLALLTVLLATFPFSSS
ncbi:hypothetical protein [Kitasatospora sp. NBC_01266]|nr:hypothetical protein [Kitasatospora sp. NBC_01266]